MTEIERWAGLFELKSGGREGQIEKISGKSGEVEVVDLYFKPFSRCKIVKVEVVDVYI